MKLLIGAVAITSTFILGGCQSIQTTAQPQTEAELASYKFQLANKEASDCAKPIMQSNSAQIVAQQVIFLTKDSSNQSMLLSTQTKLSMPQKMALKEYLAQNLKCRDAFFRGLEGTPYYSIFFKYFTTMDNVYVQLMNDEITIAQANRVKTQALENNARDLAAIQESSSQNSPLNKK